ncbi:MAG: hypothetical protein ACO1NW_13335 [Chitinophagaceae bacterium]
MKVPMKPYISRLLAILLGCGAMNVAARAETGHFVKMDTVPPPKKLPEKTTEKKVLPDKPDVIKQVPKSRKQVKPLALPKVVPVKPKVIKPKVIKGVTGLLP